MDGIALAIIGMLMGFGLGFFYMKAKSTTQRSEEVDSEVEKKLGFLVEETRNRVDLEVRAELTKTVRTELEERYTGQFREEAEEKAKRILQSTEDRARALLQKAEIERQDLIIEAKREGQKENQAARNEILKVETNISVRETKLQGRESKLEVREESLEDKENQLRAKNEAVRLVQQRVETLEGQMTQRLEEISNYSAAEAKEELVADMVDEAKLDAAKRVREIETEVLEEADKRARKVISVAIQRWAGEYVAERCVSVVTLPTDEIKGRIIGREGRNIRALEAASGVDIIIDDTPEAVMASGFDPVRREIARMSLEKLVSDGRIHPSRIEEVVAKSEKAVEKTIKKFGERAVFDLGLANVHPELIRTVGRLKYRTSYGQNIWAHSIEVGFLCGLMASELGLNVKIARRAGLLHDIGKALTHEQEGSHALVGADLCKKYGEDEVVRNAVAAHHNEEPQESVYAHLVIAADALSGARPGARREILETYVKRLQDLERISMEFDGVEKSYAVQAGREIRVVVENSKVSDDQAFLLSKEIARKIEDELTYPGQVKVCVIRESRSVDYAR
jgi:ribonucrease Y